MSYQRPPSLPSILSRWGDASFGLAMLLHDDRAAAERTTTEVLVQTLAAPTDDVEHAIYAALLSRAATVRAPRWRWGRRHILPAPLLGVAPRDRLLLALFLLREVSGAQLAELTQLAPSVLVEQLAAAVDRIEGVAEDEAPLSRAWLARQLGLARPDTTNESYELRHAWQARLDSTRATLRGAVGRLRLPPPLHERIGAELEERTDPPARPWWRERRVWLAGLVAAIGMWVLLLVPWRNSDAALAEPLPTPAEMVQRTRDAWLDPPDSGTLHRRVWARQPWDDEAVQTDLWLGADAPAHRVEVYHGEELVEWQLADGRGLLEHAATPRWSSCRWGDADALDSLIRSFVVPPAQQAAVLAERLKLGAYGTGYRALERALAADDLRSLGMRTDGDTALLVLSYTARTDTRQILLWIDPQAAQLHLVQEVIKVGAQASSRDLWRLVGEDEPRGGMSLRRPAWERSVQRRDAILDPACPGLDATHVISLRKLSDDRFWWSNSYLPSELPSDITRAALLSSTVVQDPLRLAGGIRMIFAGPQRHLVLRPSTPSGSLFDADLVRDPWRIQLSATADTYTGAACRWIEERSICGTSLQFTAVGWTRDELLATLDSLKPVDERTWIGFDTLFLEPLALEERTRQALIGALDAAAPPDNGTLHNQVEQTVRIAPARPSDDPYHVPQPIAMPERLRQEQWIEYAAAEVVRYKEQHTLADGTLLAASVNDGEHVGEYNILTKLAQTGSRESGNWWFYPPLLPQLEVLKRLISASEPIAVSADDDALLLTQQLSRYDGFPLAYVRAPYTADLDDGTYLRRIRLDHGSFELRRAELVYLTEGSQEIMLHALAFNSRRIVTDPPSAFTLPQLPADTIRVREGTITGDDLRLDLMTEALVWPADSGWTARFDRLPTQVGHPAGADTGSRLARALWTPITELDLLGLTRVTHYTDSTGRRVIVTQGPRGLLRHVLRSEYTFTADGTAAGWVNNTPIPVTIAGEEVIAWYLHSPDDVPMLVVEVGAALLHFSSADHDYLREQLPAELGKLKRVDLFATP